MPGEARRGFVHDVWRFFWLPRGMPRRPAPAGALLRVWLFCLVAGAVATAFGRVDHGAHVMLVVAQVAPLQDVADGVRHRWPAFLTALAAGWAVNRPAYAVLPGSHESWGLYCVHALMTFATLATFAGVTRLPRRRPGAS
ncbi:hypothetical protein ACIBBD_33265 [Streptomyces sp. NPDC051315]|uniref:hypothetical protein n=1 Tax=Streptomyces sp. NPDC051315 TaxID=3365650 RepID=UPI0037965F7E